MKRMIPVMLVLGFSSSPHAFELKTYLGNGKALKKATERYGVHGKERVEDWLAFIEDIKPLPTMEKLQQVNDYFNHIPYISDEEHWGVPDHWATPVEFIASNGGDCEDYTIAKLATLVAAGVSPENLRMTYSEIREQKIAHMVLTYHETPQAMPLVLDNGVPNISLASSRPDIQPLFSFNTFGSWQFVDRQPRQVSTTNDIDLLNELMVRMKKEYI